MPSRCLALAVLLMPLGSLAGGAAEQPRRPDPVPLPPLPPASIDRALPPYQDQLDRLAEVMGTLAYLRDLCGGGDGATWRERMARLLEAEGSTPARRERLAGHYNRGYAGYQVTYHACTPAAETVLTRALREGDRIAAALTSQNGTP